MNQEQFMAALGARNAEREKLRETARELVQAIRVQHRRVDNMSTVVVPGLAWVGSFGALTFMWAALSVHGLVEIMLFHIFFRAFSRVFMNAFWIPSLVRDLKQRFPAFADDIERSWKEEDDGN